MSLLRKLCIYLTPQMSSYSSVYDKFIDDLMSDEHTELDDVSDHWACVSYNSHQYKLWIANKWYSYLSECWKNEHYVLADQRPSRKTMYMFSRWLDAKTDRFIAQRLY